MSSTAMGLALIVLMLFGSRDQRVDRGATIRGRVLSLETGRPIKRVNVIISSVGSAVQTRATVATDSDGRFELPGLQPARYRLVATKEGFVTTAYGQRGPVDSWRPIDLARGQIVDKIEVRLPRGAVIAGRVVDEDGVPFPEVAIAALQYRLVAGRRRLAPVREAARTNDLGEFRVFGLQPGEYYVSATYRAASGDATDGAGGAAAYVPMYFPGAFVLTDAQRLTVSASQEGTADFQLVPMRGRRVTGTAISADGAALTSGLVRMRPAGDIAEADVRTTNVAADGSFHFVGVAPGTYTLTVTGGRSTLDTQGLLPDVPSVQEFGHASVTVAGEDMEGVQLQSIRGGTIRGRVKFVTPPRPSDLQVTRVICGPSGPDSVIPGSRSVSVRGDGSFELRDVFGPCVMGAVAPGWSIRAIRHGEEEALDQPLEVSSGGVTEGVEIVFTNTDTGIEGTVTGDRDAPASDFVVVVVPADRSGWRFPSRRMRSGRPDQNGRFRVTGLPPGDYLAVALADGDESAAQDIDVLDRLRPTATPITVADGAMRPVQLKLMNLVPLSR